MAAVPVLYDGSELPCSCCMRSSYNHLRRTPKTIRGGRVFVKPSEDGLCELH